LFYEFNRTQLCSLESGNREWNLGSLSDQIQGQIAAGFLITGFYEDNGEALLDGYSDTFIAARAGKL
jgi:hypothetical protein